MKKRFIAVILLCFPLLVGASNVLYINGESAEKEVAQIIFSGDSALVTFSDDTQIKIDISLLKVVFTEPDATETPNSEAAFYVVKTRVDDVLSIGGVVAGTLVSVLDMQGRTCLSKSFETEDGSLDISRLAAGIYFLRANGQVIKFIKK